MGKAGGVVVAIHLHKTIVLENINLYSYGFQIFLCHLRRGWSFTLVPRPGSLGWHRC